MKKMLTPMMMRRCLAQVYIRRNRQCLYVSQDDLARGSGMSVEYLADIEDGTTTASWRELKVLCDNLGLSFWKGVRLTVWSWFVPLWYLRWKISRI